MTNLSQREREQLLEVVELQTVAFTMWGDLGTPFYGALAKSIAADIVADGPLAGILAPYATRRFEDGALLRFFGGVHHCVLRGGAPALAAHFPSTGGDGDAEAAFPHVRALAADPPEDVLDALARKLQTNEVARSAALGSGLAVIAHETGLPIRLREMGSSAGLNLRPDAYFFEQDGSAWGDASSPVRFTGLWSGGVPPFDAPATIVDRRGCDIDPIDLSDEEGARWLLSYIWPEPPHRFERMRDAIALAAADPPVVDEMDAGEWIRDQLRTRSSGTVFVVQHSVMWQYMSPETQVEVESVIREAGASMTRDTPLAWLRLEPRPISYLPGELKLTLWDGSDPDPPDRLLATTTFHGGPIKWRAGAG